MPVSMIGPRNAAWTLCAVTHSGSGYQDVKNALLYGEHVHWVSTETVGMVIASIAHPQEHPDEDGNHRIDIVRTAPYDAFLSEIQSSGAGQFIAQHLDEGEATVTVIRIGLSGAIAEGKPGEALSKAISAHIEIAAAQSKVIVSQYPPSLLQEWNEYKMTRFLQKPISRILLPDVSRLPIRAILEMRVQLADVLGQMHTQFVGFLPASSFQCLGVPHPCLTDQFLDTPSIGDRLTNLGNEFFGHVN